jgi:hypothetical protein
LHASGPKLGGEVVAAGAAKEVEFLLAEAELDAVRERLARIDTLLTPDALKRTPSKRRTAKPSKRSSQLLQGR